jgi:hypothetical protein
MPTLALEGTGARIVFGSTGLSADLISLTLPDRAKDPIATGHLGRSGTAVHRPSRLVDPGQVVVVFDHVPGAPALLRRPPETVTIHYPLRADQSAPDRIVFTAFATAEGGTDVQVGERLTRQVTLTLTSDLTQIPGAGHITTVGVSPILERLTANGNGTWTALWGWNSLNTLPVIIPIGPDNGFVPAPAARGQPALFLPGRQYGQFTTIITATLVWSLRGPDGARRTATAGVA